MISCTKKPSILRHGEPRRFDGPKKKQSSASSSSSRLVACFSQRPNPSITLSVTAAPPRGRPAHPRVARRPAPSCHSHQLLRPCAALPAMLETRPIQTPQGTADRCPPLLTGLGLGTYGVAWKEMLNVEKRSPRSRLGSVNWRFYGIACCPYLRPPKKSTGKSILSCRRKHLSSTASKN